MASNKMHVFSVNNGVVTIKYNFIKKLLEANNEVIIKTGLENAELRQENEKLKSALKIRMKSVHCGECNAIVGHFGMRHYEECSFFNVELKIDNPNVNL